MIPLSSNVTLYSSSKQLAHFIHGSTFSPVFFFLGNPIRWCNITHYSCVIQPKSNHHQASNLQSFQRRTGPLAHESMAYHDTLIRDREKQIQGWTWWDCITMDALGWKLKTIPVPSAMSWTTAIFTHLKTSCKHALTTYTVTHQTLSKEEEDLNQLQFMSFERPELWSWTQWTFGCLSAGTIYLLIPVFLHF